MCTTRHHKNFPPCRHPFRENWNFFRPAGLTVQQLVGIGFLFIQPLSNGTRWALQCTVLYTSILKLSTHLKLLVATRVSLNLKMIKRACIYLHKIIKFRRKAPHAISISKRCKLIPVRRSFGNGGLNFLSKVLLVRCYACNFAVLILKKYYHFF